ncbi:glutathione binding-like protein [Dolichospermum sp. ST_sed5]|nr:glutathione binding-like protein [Dolichospermum sp. ST_sed5]
MMSQLLYLHQPEIVGQPQAVADSTEIFKFLESYQPEPALFLPNLEQQTQAAMLEDWLDESIGPATRFVYYQFRAGEGKAIDSSLFSQMVIKVVRQQYGINDTTVELARKRLANALLVLSIYWQKSDYLVGSRLSVADIAAAALLSPLALIPDYRQQYPQVFERIINIHQLCAEPLPPGI